MVIIWSGPIWLELSMLGHFQIWHLWMHKPKFGPLKQKLHHWGKTPLANDTNVPRKYPFMTVFVHSTRTHSPITPHFAHCCHWGKQVLQSDTIASSKEWFKVSIYLYSSMHCLFWCSHLFANFSVIFLIQIMMEFS